MESSYKPSFDGTEANGNGVKVADRRSSSSSSSSSSSVLLLRILAAVTTLIAVIVMGVSKQTKTVPITILPTLPPLDVEVTAKWQYLSAFTYFMVANITACVYAIVSLIYTFLSRAGSKINMGLAFSILDLMILVLLFSAGGAAGAVGLLGLKGNAHVRWGEVCNVFGSFCGQGAAAIVVSLIGGLAFFALILLNLHIRSP